MAQPDTKNAHIRKGGRRQAPEVLADEAQRLLDDPAFVRGFDTVRESMVRAITEFKHDGSPEADAYERECCRTLRTLTSLKRAIALGVQGQKLRLADFRPGEFAEGE